ncbi:MAG: hypothetical protein Ta2E_05430 [Mycoplasmoidaceae bacterium]|nr:MAG: hypothetical protein Ta2E_05430 [Mycoplasmoidaceae bacterium]
MRRWAKWTIGLILAAGTGVGIFCLVTMVKCGGNEIGPWGQIRLKSGKININTKEEWMTLCNNKHQDEYMEIRNTKFYKKNITEYIFGTEFDLEKVPDNFLYRCGNLEKISKWKSDDVLPPKIKEIGDNFLRDTMYNSLLVLPKTLIKIGANFLRNSYIRSSFALPQQLQRIDGYFLADCGMLNGSFNFPDSLSKTYGSTRGIGEGIFHNCHAFNNWLYLNLVTCTDFEVPSAQIWTGYPNNPQYGSPSFGMDVPYLVNHSKFYIASLSQEKFAWEANVILYFGTVHDENNTSYAPSHRVTSY